MAKRARRATVIGFRKLVTIVIIIWGVKQQATAYCAVRCLALSDLFGTGCLCSYYCLQNNTDNKL